ncbi:tail completion protein gp17 [Xenorhabdus entomophaga]|uniref:tail completion protein gp17 n=1 Tax=Xenorhabdus entomophaga TaxID=3136257 RepID=UPI0030F411AC
MTEADIFPLLNPVLPYKVFPYVAPQSEPPVTPPWCVFSFYSLDQDVLNGQAGQLNNLQIDVYAGTIDEARAIRNKARSAIAGLNPTELSETQGYEPDTSLYRATLECQIWQ